MSARNRFVTPEVKRLNLSEGDWVDVKKRLGIAEAKRIESALFRGIQGNERMAGRADADMSDVEVRLDATLAYMTKLEVYIVDWSFRDADDKAVKVSPSAIAALDPDTADEILAALNEFLDEEDKARKDPFTEKSSEQQSA